MRILRENLPVTDYQTLTLPLDAKILSVAPCRSGREHIDLWYTDPEQPHRGNYEVGIYVVGTGHLIPQPVIGTLGHRGTCVMSSGLVWHVFEGPAAEADQ